MRGKTNWKMIKVPALIHSRLKKEAEKRRCAIWKVIYGALSAQKKAHLPRDEPDLDRRAWYAFKLSASVGVFKEAPTPVNWEFVMMNCDAIELRLGVDCSMLREAAGNYREKPTKRRKIALNEATKTVIKKIFMN